jgi:pSer/pThr/pTyr-binding forkhead associated (FHA) protein
MYLQVVISDRKPVYYKLSKSEIVLGVMPAADIIVSEASVSKKHLKLFVQDNALFIVDQGSTNGTYVESERLVPGKRVEFKEDVEVRLGTEVFLKRVKEVGKAPVFNVLEKTVPPSQQASSTTEKTTVLSLEDFRAAEALAKEKKKEEFAEKRKKENQRKVKEKRSMTRSLIFFLLIVVIGVYINKNYKINHEGAKNSNITKAARALADQEKKLINVEP